MTEDHGKETVSRSRLEMESQSEHGISLADVWLVMRRRRIWIWSTLAGVVTLSFVATVAMLLLAPAYESRAVLSIGHIGGKESIEDAHTLVQRLRARYRIDDPDFKRKFPYMTKIRREKDANRVIWMFARGSTPKQAQAFLQDATSTLLTEHRARFEAILNEQSRRLRSVEEALERLDRQIGELTEHIQRVTSIDPAQAAVIALEKAKLLADRPNLEAIRTNLTLGLLPPASEPTQLLLQPTLPSRPIRPRPVLYVSVGLLLGLLSGVAAAFAAESLANIRRQLKSHEVS